MIVINCKNLCSSLSMTDLSEPRMSYHNDDDDDADDISSVMKEFYTY